MNVSAWSIRNPIPAILLFMLLTLAGLMAFRAMKVQNFPDIDLPMVIVTASLPGAAPGQLETEVARKSENSIATVQGLKHLYTTITDGMVGTGWMGETHFASVPHALYGVVLFPSAIAYWILQPVIVREHHGDTIIAQTSQLKIRI